MVLSPNSSFAGEDAAVAVGCARKDFTEVLPMSALFCSALRAFPDLNTPDDSTLI
jgi:hypothetical protein